MLEMAPEFIYRGLESIGDYFFMQDTLQKLAEDLTKLPEKAPGIAEYLTSWALTHGIRILLILIGMWVLVQIAKLVGKRIILVTSDDDPTTENERERRAKTLVQIFNLTVKIVVTIFGGISIIKELGFDIGPVLAGAGIIGLAIGFGSQSLVKDIVSGFFLIMENQIRVGDVVKIGDCAGLVEKITLRIVILRDLEGVVHVIPNGEIKTLSNMTYGWSRAVVTVSVAYKEDTNRVMEILKLLAMEFYKDEKYSKVIMEEPSILGIDSMGESAVTVKVLFKTNPLSQWDIARAYRLRVKNEFDKLGIEIPFPQRTVYIRQEDDRETDKDKGKSPK
jgi:small conductance mechanosensitive channel